MQNVSVDYYEVEDGSFGSPLPNGTWTGMIGDLIRNKADVIVGPVSVSGSRFQVVSFTPSYFDTGLSLLVTKETDADNPFSFLLPFSWEVWILLLVSMFVVSCLSWIFDLCSPYGYRKGADDVETLSFSSSLFNSAATLVGQGGEIGRSWSSRVLLVGYCVFAMIALSTYTANLAAFLTTKIQATTVSSLSDLRTYGFKFGVPRDSDPALFISTSSQMADIRKNMILYKDLEECIGALRNKSISAVIWANSVVEYVANQPPCDTLKVGELFDKSNMAMPFTKGSYMVDHFSILLLKLRANGVIDQLVQSWWIDKGSCSAISASNVASGITIHDFWGVFLLLAVFFVLSLIILIVENIFHRFVYHKVTKKSPKVLIGKINSCLGGSEEEKKENQIQELMEKLTTSTASTDDCYYDGLHNSKQ